uniref:Uncharacterized protein n=1 Tax=Anguilla anguilla TaxID=7936 RepID=A0A0E9PWQ3_ANGAN
MNQLKQGTYKSLEISRFVKKKKKKKKAAASEFADPRPSAVWVSVSSVLFPLRRRRVT